MKTIKVVIATIAFSMFGIGLSAQELPPQAQKQIERAEKLSKGKAKQKRAQKKGDESDDQNADEQEAGKQKANKGKAGKQKAEEKKRKHAKKAGDNKSDVRGDGAADGADSARPTPNENRSAKGLTRAEEEERKHLFRLAKIDRIQSIARTNNNDKLLSKSMMLREKENRRHLRALNRKGDNVEQDKQADQVDKPETARD